MASLSLSAKFFKLLSQADLDGPFPKAANLVKSDGVEPTAAQICDGLAVLTNKHPMRGWECHNEGPGGNEEWIEAARVKGRRFSFVFETRLKLRPSVLNWACKRKFAHVFQ
jgi:hypothetical protein